MYASWPSVQSWALGEHIAFRPVPFLTPLYNPALQCHSGDVIHLAVATTSKTVAERRLGQSDCAFLLRFNDEQMGGVVGRICKHIQAVPASVWIGDGYGAPSAHEEQYTARGE